MEAGCLPAAAMAFPGKEEAARGTGEAGGTAPAAGNQIRR